MKRNSKENYIVNHYYQPQKEEVKVKLHLNSKVESNQNQNLVEALCDRGGKQQHLEEELIEILLILSVQEKIAYEVRFMVEKQTLRM